MPPAAASEAPHELSRRVAAALTLITSALSSLIGLGVLIGWWLESTALTTVSADWVPMVPSTALGLVLAGLGLGLLRRRRARGFGVGLGRLLASGATAVGILGVAESFTGRDLGLLRWLLPEAAWASVPLSMSLITALNLALAGLMLLLLDARSWRGVRIAEVLAAIVGFSALIAFAAYVYGSPPYYGVPNLLPFTGMAIHTAFGLMLLAMGGLAARPSVGAMATITSTWAGGYMARRMLAAAGAIPLLGLVVSLGAASGWYPHELAASLVSGLAMVVAVALVIAIGRRLNAADADRQRALSELQTSQERYRTLIDLAPDGIFLATLDGRYTAVNRAGAQMLGYEQSEVVGKTILDLLEDEDVPRLMASRELQLTGQADVWEWQLKGKDGSLVPVEVHAKMLPDGRWQGFVRDLTNRKLAERKQRAAEERYRSLVESARDAIVVTDAQGRIELVNHQAEVWFGYERSELVGRPLSLLLPEPAQPQAPLSARRKDGSHFPVEVSTSASMIEAEQRPIRTLILRDVTDRIRQEKEQRFLVDLSRLLSESLDLQVTLEAVVRRSVPELADWCIVDLMESPGGLRRAAIIHADPRRNALADELLRRTSGPVKALEGVSTALEQRAPVLLTALDAGWVRKHAPDAELAQLMEALGVRSYMVVPLLGRKEPLGTLTFVAASHDFSPADLRFAEEIARRAGLAAENGRLFEDAQAAIRIREDVVAVVSHDLKNPLNAIQLSTSQLLERQLPALPVDDETREPMRRGLLAIRRADERAIRLISDLLDFAKLEAGSLALELKPVAVAELLEEVIDLLEPLARERQVHLAAAEDGGLWARCDRRRVLQVLSNLVGNAIKFSSTPSTIWIRAAGHASAQVLFSVSDRGPGIAPEDLEHIFDRYWQPRTTRRQGTGLGLAIAKRLVDAHGGSIWAKSERGVGSTFCFTVPRAREAESERALRPH